MIEKTSTRDSKHNSYEAHNEQFAIIKSDATRLKSIAELKHIHRDADRFFLLFSTLRIVCRDKNPFEALE